MISYVLVQLWWLLGSAGLGQATALPEHPIQEDLKDVSDSLKHERNLLRHLNEKSSSVLQTLHDIEKKLSATEEEVRIAEAEQQKLETELEQILFGQSRATTTQEKARPRLRQRLREMYKQTEWEWLTNLFSSRTIDEGLAVLRYVAYLAKQDRCLMLEMQRTQQELAKAQRQILQRKQQLEILQRQTEERREQVRQAHQEKRKTLTLITREKNLRSKTVLELDHARGQLMELIETLEGSGSKAKGFASWQGRLPSPVVNARIEVPFGLRIDPRFNTKTRQLGLDIRAKKGAPVLAIYPGKVVFAKNFQGYGLMAILDHGSRYYSLYGHLGTLLVQASQAVTQGQTLGTLGDTGSLKGPYLYFEVREGGKAVDPAAWVKF